MIAICIIKQFDLFAQLFDEIYIPEAVASEILSAKSERVLSVNELKQALSDNTFNIYIVKDKQLVNKLFGKLHKGELEVIVGAREINV